MENEETQVVPTSEEEQTTDVEAATDEPEQQPDVDWKAEAEKAKEIAENYKKRAEKAEKRAKTAPKTVENSTELTQNDVIFLAKADIHEDDIAEVTDLAKLKGISVKEAHAYLKPVLAVRAEERQTAAATQTKGARGKKPVTGDDYLQKARQTGEVPETNEGINALIRARVEERKNRNRR